MNEDFSCCMAMILVHIHAQNEYQIQAFLEASSEAVSEAIEQTLRAHPDVELVELAQGGYSDEEEDLNVG